MGGAGGADVGGRNGTLFKPGEIIDPSLARIKPGKAIGFVCESAGGGKEGGCGDADADVDTSDELNVGATDVEGGDCDTIGAGIQFTAIEGLGLIVGAGVASYP